MNQKYWNRKIILINKIFVEDDVFFLYCFGIFEMHRKVIITLLFYRRYYDMNIRREKKRQKYQLQILMQCKQEDVPYLDLNFSTYQAQGQCHDSGLIIGLMGWHWARKFDRKKNMTLIGTRIWIFYNFSFIKITEYIL